MQVVFTRRADNGTVAEFVRPDGVHLRLRSYDRTGLVPHDAAHLLVEGAFGLEHGVWGCLAQGGLFESVEVVAGRTRHDHRARSTTLLKRHEPELRLAENLVGAALAALSEGTRELSTWTAAGWALYRGSAPKQLASAGLDAVARLRDLQGRWARLRTGQTFDLQWPTPPPGARIRPVSRWCATAQIP